VTPLDGFLIEWGASENTTIVSLPEPEPEPEPVQ
jgi:hypothetical protein